MICSDCTSYLWMLGWRCSNKIETRYLIKILIFIHCCCVLTVSLKRFVWLLSCLHFLPVPYMLHSLPLSLCWICAGMFTVAWSICWNLERAAVPVLETQVILNIRPTRNCDVCITSTSSCMDKPQDSSGFVATFERSVCPFGSTVFFYCSFWLGLCG